MTAPTTHGHSTSVIWFTLTLDAYHFDARSLNTHSFIDATFTTAHLVKSGKQGFGIAVKLERAVAAAITAE